MADIHIKITLGAAEAQTTATEAKNIAAKAQTTATEAKTQSSSLNSWKLKTADAILPRTQYSNSLRLYRKTTKDNGAYYQRLLVSIPEDIMDNQFTFELWRYTNGKVRYSEKLDDGSTRTTIRSRRIGWTKLDKVSLKATRYSDNKVMNDYYDIRLNVPTNNTYKELIDVTNGEITYINRNPMNIGEDMEVYNYLYTYRHINFFTGKYYKNATPFGMKQDDKNRGASKNNKLGIKVYIGSGETRTEVAFLPFSIIREYTQKEKTDGVYLVPSFFIGRWR